MSDIRIISQASLAGVWTDWLLSPGGQLDESDDLSNVVLLTLLTDALADEDEVLPDPDSTDRRGWWADLEAEVIWDGWPIGCKNWLLTRAKITPYGSAEGDTVARAEMYTRASLQPLIDRRMCSAIDVTARRNGIDRIDVLVTVYRGPKDEINLEFQGLWNALVNA